MAQALVTFSVPSNFNPDDLNKANLQCLFVSQETLDNIDDALRSPLAAVEGANEAAAAATAAVVAANAAVAAAVAAAEQAVSAVTDGLTAAIVPSVPGGGLASTDVQAALYELDSEKAVASHTHSSAAITDFATAAVAALGAVVRNVNGHTGATVAVTKGDVGLGSADNTSDANKPVSTATATALAAKLNSSDFATALGTNLAAALGGTLGTALASLQSGSDVVGALLLGWFSTTNVGLSPGATISGGSIRPAGFQLVSNPTTPSISSTSGDNRAGTWRILGRLSQIPGSSGLSLFIRIA